jgi:hypothetical protein
MNAHSVLLVYIITGRGLELSSPHFIQPAPSLIMQVRSKALLGGNCGNPALAPLQAVVHSAVLIPNSFKPVKISRRHNRQT